MSQKAVGRYESRGIGRQIWVVRVHVFLKKKNVEDDDLLEPVKQKHIMFKPGKVDISAKQPRMPRLGILRKCDNNNMSMILCAMVQLSLSAKYIFIPMAMILSSQWDSSAPGLADTRGMNS